MAYPSNPLAVLTFISAPAILTNASCVLLFGTGNRYGRAIDRVHELSEIVQKSAGADEAELRLRIRQLEAAGSRTLLIVRALTCFYTAVAGFVASTLLSLIGAIVVYTHMQRAVAFIFGIAFLSGTLGMFAVVAGAIMLSRESRFSLRILREEKNFISEQNWAARSEALQRSPCQVNPYKGEDSCKSRIQESTHKTRLFSLPIFNRESSSSHKPILWID